MTPNTNNTSTQKSGTSQPYCPPYPPYPDPRLEEDEIDLAELWATLVKRKRFILGFTFAITLATIVATFFMTPKYESEVLMAPISSGSGSGLSALASQYGGLASLAGISLPGKQGGLTEEAVAVLESKQFLAEFIKQYQLKPVLFYKNWDAQQQQWIVEEPSLIQSAVQTLKDTLKNFLGRSETANTTYPGQEILAPGEPSMLEAVNFFKKEIMQLSNDKKTGMYTLKITWEDPVLARDWANTLVTMVNQKLRQQNIQNAEKTIQYLKKQLETIRLVELKQVIYSIIEEQVKNITLAKVQEDYVFKIIDPATVAEQPAKPKKKLIIVVAFVTALILAVFMAFFLEWLYNMKREKQNPSQNKSQEADG